MIRLRSLLHMLLNCLRTLIALATGACGIGILAAHLVYLRHSPHPLQSFPYLLHMRHIKMMIVLYVWLVALLLIRLNQKYLALRHLGVRREVVHRSLLAGVLFTLSIAAYDPPQVELGYYFMINSLAYGMIVYAFSQLSAIEPCCMAAGKGALRLLRLPPLLWIRSAFAFVLLASYWLGGALFQHFPWIDDTIVQTVHAKFLAHGHWYGQSMPYRSFFDTKWMINDGKWYSQYPPGHVIMLAIGTLLHAVAWVNPMLGAATCIAIWLLAKELYGAHVARIAVLLSALCVYMLLLSSEYMNNATSLLMCTLFLWAYFRVLNQRGLRYGPIAGAALGYCFIVRPFTAVTFALPQALYGFYLSEKRPREYKLQMMAIAWVFAAFVGFQLYYNKITTGEPLLFGYQRLQGPRSNPFTETSLKRLGFERLDRNLRMDVQRLSYFNYVLFHWPLPAMALVALLFSLRGNRRNEQLLLATIASMFVSVEFITNREFGYGPRLLYELTGILIVCCAKALTMLPPLLRKLSPRRHRLSYYYGGGVFLLASFYLVAFQFALKIPAIKGVYQLYDREGNPEFYREIVRNVTPPALVFVPQLTYRYVAFTNPPEINSPVVFAIDFGSHDEELFRFYPRRHKYYVTLEEGHPEVHTMEPPVH